ncbi:MAG: 3-hydroxyacyl-CoA dehydrogenase NAD-binding domain-containing protein [Hyphomicrobiaceae bacterium]
MPGAEYSFTDGIAVITIDNPPVNAMSPGVPDAIVAGLRRANADPAVIAIVIRGAGHGGIAGADIRMFGKPWPDGKATLRDVITAIEASGKPVVAALRSQTLGGGLEIALSCHYRVAAPDAAVGQPEVKLGFPPGAGGTQRLPRLTGIEAALAMIVGGNPVPAGKAKELGILDAVIEGDLLAGAVTFAASRIAGGGPHPLARDKTIEMRDRAWFDARRAEIAKKARGQHAALACVDCIEAAVNLPFDQGIAREREIFEVSMRSAESKALRHVFFAERAASKVPGLAKDTRALPISSAAVIGSGTMGSGITMCFADAGIDVSILDANPAQLERGLANIRKNYEAMAAKGRITTADVGARLGRIRSVTSYGALKDADIIIEAVFEEMPIKKQVFAELDRVAKSSAILASNTSYLDVDEIAATMPGRTGKVLGLHFFSPANVMRLLEVVKTRTVSAETLATVLALGKRLRKLPIVAGVCHGFIGNRMLSGYLREAEFLLEEGASPAEVDKAITDFGLPMGPFAMKDLAGLDIGYRNRKAFAHRRDPDKRVSSVDDRLNELGRLGQKTGAGYYRYEPGSRTPIPDAVVDQVIADAAAAAGITRRRIDASEIVARCLYPLVNEGARVLEEGIAVRASDIDLVWINGYGFPAWRGGPMHWADSTGLGAILDGIKELAKAHDYWEPAPLLERLVREGKTFSDLDSKETANA